MRHINIPIFVPHKGCPNDCSFCNQRSITAITNDVSASEVDQTIKTALEAIANDDCYVEVAFFGGSFTGIEKQKQKELLEVAKYYKTQGRIDGIRLSTRPDYIDDETLKMLKEYGVTVIELGVQSTDDAVLEQNRRGHTKADVIEAVKIIRDYDISLGLQMMLGLYGTSREKDIKTALDIIELKPDFVRIYPTLVIAGTYLCELYRAGEYKPLDVADGVSLATDVFKLFYAADINVIRVGLMNSENIAIGADVVAGPFHEAFGELVWNKIYLDAVLSYLQNKRQQKPVTIYANPLEMSKVIGHKRGNLEKLRQIYGDVSIKVNSTLEMGTVKIDEDIIKV